MKALLDNNLSPLLARAIAILVEPSGHEVVALRDKYPANAKDEDWIVELGRQAGGWVVISGDIKIAKRPSEREAWRSSALIGFFLAPAWSGLTNIERAARLLLWWPKIVAQADLIAPGAIFQLPVNAGSKMRQLKW